MPYFADPAIGIVQSPQCFDTDGSMNWIERAAGSAQEWFFRWIQPSRDASDAAICCGSAVSSTPFAPPQSPPMARLRIRLYGRVNGQAGLPPQAPHRDLQVTA